MKTLVIGTTPVLVLNPNKKRKYWLIQFILQTIQAGNTGIVFVGRGFVPVATMGDANQGEALVNGSAIEEMKAFAEDTRPYKGPIWAVSNTANQLCTVEETTDSE